MYQARKKNFVPPSTQQGGGVSGPPLNLPYLVPPSTIPSLLNKEVEFSGPPTKPSLLSKKGEFSVPLQPRES